MRGHRMDGSNTKKWKRGRVGRLEVQAASNLPRFQTSNLLNNEQGQSTTATFPLVALVLVLLLTLAVFVVKIRTAQVSVAAAARACARQTVETLDPARGMEQGRQAGLSVLAARHLDPDRAEVEVIPLGAWDRNGQVECRVRYTVSLRGIPFMALISSRSEIQLTAAYRVQIEPYKSRWEGP